MSKYRKTIIIGILMTIGIYQIQNKINGKIYIGQSIDIEKRLKQHLRYLRKSQHYNSHFQNAFDKYGENAKTTCKKYNYNIEKLK